MAAGGRVSILAGVRRTIADIKEIAGGHSDEEVYAMLRDCNMDPNETAQKLLLQGYRALPSGERKGRYAKPDVQLNKEMMYLKAQ